MKNFLVTSGEGWSVVVKEVLLHLRPGTIITLSGPLGAGKTTFVQALAKELGAKGSPRSPTFSLLRAYQLPKRGVLKRLVHVDAYRLEKPEDVIALDLDMELAEPGTIVTIEWPENIVGWIERQKRPLVRMVISLDTHGARRASVDFTNE